MLGYILGPVLFLIYKNYLHYAIKHCKVYHFADDANFSNLSHSIKNIKEQVKYGLKNLNNWLKSNRICFNVGNI